MSVNQQAVWISFIHYESIFALSHKSAAREDDIHPT